jgi:hypothetical protein
MIETPLDERVGHISGVESVVVDGRRWYFGMDYGSDLVVSPLIDDPGRMAEFAARYMAQTTGTHDAAYWAALDIDPDDEWDAVGEALGDDGVQHRLREYFAATLPANWSTVFASLLPGDKEVPSNE